MYVRKSRVAVAESLEKRALLSVATFGNGTTTGGTYTYVDFMEESRNYFVSSRGYVSMNAAGAIAGAQTEASSTDGQAPQTDSFSESYSLGNDGWFNNGETGGYASTKGDLALLSSVNNTGDPYTALTVAVRRGTGMSNASANGRYNMVMWLGNGLNFATAKGYADMLGNGNLNYNISNVWQGQATAADRIDVGSGPDTYSVSPDGSLSVSESWVGALRADGQMFVFGDGGSSPVGDVGITVGVKQGTGMTNASVKGRYQGILIASGIQSGIKYFSSAAMWVDLNGSGGMNGSIWKTVQGQASGSWIPNNSFTGTYSLSSTGALTVSDGNSLNGYVSADGSVVVIPMVAKTASKENGLMVLMRAPIAGKTGGVLQMNGTSLNDVLAATPSGANLVVSSNFGQQTFPLAGLTQITADGGLGNDRITVNATIATLLKGGSGNDTVVGFGGADTIYGNDGNDVLYGNSGNDSILAGLGNDNVDASSGNDSIFGGDGTDSIHGGIGDDYVEGRGKADTIYGDDGNDTIYGAAGADIIYGNAGNDFIDVGVASVFHDSVYGGTGTDTVVADGDDVVSGAEVLA